ncbi:MAG: asparaginase [Flavobacteriales bacterium]
MSGAPTQTSEVSRILLIYTGGTIGSVHDGEAGGLVPIDFGQITEHVPELEQSGRWVETVSFVPPIDSSNIEPTHWVRLARTIEQRYEEFDGFVILHGTDTLAYTASALSFMLAGLHKPVILTGSQLPIGLPRTDGRENLLAAVEIATAERFGAPLVQEVAVYFGNSLYRGNRCHKASAESLQAIISPNLPPLAEAGVDIIYDYAAFWDDPDERLRVHSHMEPCVAWLPFFPGISIDLIRQVTEWKDLKGLVLSTFGSGNAPSGPLLKAALADAHDRGVTMVNVSQCGHGAVHPERYATAHLLRDCGVIAGGDMTTEAALTKLMSLLGRGFSRDDIRAGMLANLRGERTVSSALD